MARFPFHSQQSKKFCAYIAGQAEHHRGKSFAEEYARFVKVYGLEWRDEETVETVSSSSTNPTPLVKTRGQRQTKKNANRKAQAFIAGRLKL